MPEPVTQNQGNHQSARKGCRCPEAQNSEGGELRVWAKDEESPVSKLMEQRTTRNRTVNNRKVALKDREMRKDPREEEGGDTPKGREEERNEGVDVADEFKSKK